MELISSHDYSIMSDKHLVYLSAVFTLGPTVILSSVGWLEIHDVLRRMLETEYPIS